MLVLSRKKGESIVIPELGVTIKVVGLGAGRARLGIDAPRSVLIQRVEVLNRIEDERKLSERKKSQSLSGEHAIVS